MREIFDFIFCEEMLISIILVAICLTILGFIKKFLIKKVAYTTHDEKHKNTLIGVVFNIMQYIVVIATILMVLKVWGNDLTTVLAGLGIVATIVGLALQDSIKDVISGINIYNNNFYKVGDVVVYDGQYCEVKYFSARVSKFLVLATGSTITLNNCNISQIEKVKEQVAITVNFDFEDDKTLIDKAFAEACEIINNHEGLSNASYWGVCGINETAVVYGMGFDGDRRQILLNKAFGYSTLYECFKKYGCTPSFNDEIRVKESRNI